jgi:hypothetical protein
MAYALAALAEARIGLGDSDATERAARAGIAEASKLGLKTPQIWFRLALGNVLMGAARPEPERREANSTPRER